MRRLASDEGFVGLDRPGERPLIALRHQISPDEAQHSVRGLVGDPDLPFKLLRGDPTSRTRHQIDGVEPQLQRRGRLVKDRLPPARPTSRAEPAPVSSAACGRPRAMAARPTRRPARSASRSRNPGRATSPPTRSSRCGRATLGEERDGEPVTLVGPLGHVNAGDQLVCTGVFSEHARHGWRFAVTTFRSALPQSPEGIALWLMTRVPGIGRTFARAIVDHFGAERVFKELDRDPEPTHPTAASPTTSAAPRVEQSQQLEERYLARRSRDTWATEEGRPRALRRPSWLRRTGRPSRA
jgi:hypothetical protein